MRLNDFSHFHYSSGVDKSRMCCLQPLVSTAPGVLGQETPERPVGDLATRRVHRTVLSLNRMKELRLQYRSVKNNLNMAECAEEVKISIYLLW